MEGRGGEGSGRQKHDQIIAMFSDMTPDRNVCSYCVCVCVYERGRERKRERWGGNLKGVALWG